MNPSNTLETNIKKWVSLDNDIKQLNTQIKSLRGEKDLYSNDILEYISNNNLENATIKLPNGKLKFVDVNTSQPLTYKFICECLYEYLDQDDDKVLDIITYIKSHRQIKVTKEIKRY